VRSDDLGRCRDLHDPPDFRARAAERAKRLRVASPLATRQCRINRFTESRDTMTDILPIICVGPSHDRSATGDNPGGPIASLPKQMESTSSRFERRGDDPRHGPIVAQTAPNGATPPQTQTVMRAPCTEGLRR